MKFHDMNRKQLQALCKQHGIPANRTNREMADRLASTIKDEEKLKSPLEDRVVTSMEVEGENYSKILTKNVKKVRFSPENETFLFEKSENDSNSDEDFTPTKKQRKSKRKLNKAGLDKSSGKTTVVVKSSRIKKSISQVLELAKNSSETLTSSVDLGSDQTGGTAEQSSEISLNVGASDFAKPVRRSKRLAPGQDTTESLAESNVVPVATENGRNLKRKQEPESNEVTSITKFVPVPKNCTRRSTRLSSKDVLVVNEEQLSECSGKKQQKISNLQPTSEKSQVVESNLPQKASLSTESESGGHKITRRSSRIASNSDVDITEEQIDGKKQDITKLKPSHQQTQLSECTVALEKALNSECKPVAVKPTRRCTRKSTCIASEVDLVVTNRQTGKCFGKKQQNITKLQPTFEQTQLLEKTLASDKTLCVESEPIDTQPTKRFTRQSSKRGIVGTKEQTDSGFAKKQRRISKLPATIEQSQISESMLAPKETLSTEFELATKPSRTSTCPTSKSSLVVTDGQNGKVLRKRQVTKSKHEPLIEKPIRQSSRVASKEQKVGSQDRATEVVMPKVSSQLNEDLSTEQLDQGGVDFNLLGLEKGSEAESSPTSHVQNLEIYYLDEHTTENEKSSIVLDQNSELLEDAHPDGVSSLQEIQDNNELENQQIAQSTALEKSSTNYSETESTIDATKASESIIGDESLQKSDIKNLGDEKTEDSNFEEILYGEPVSPFVENKDNFDTEENIEASIKFNKGTSSEHTASKHEDNVEEEDYICAIENDKKIPEEFDTSLNKSAGVSELGRQLESSPDIHSEKLYNRPEGETQSLAGNPLKNRDRQESSPCKNFQSEGCQKGEFDAEQCDNEFGEVNHDFFMMMPLQETSNVDRSSTPICNSSKSYEVAIEIAMNGTERNERSSTLKVVESVHSFESAERHNALKTEQRKTKNVDFDGSELKGTDSEVFTSDQEEMMEYKTDLYSTGSQVISLSQEEEVPCRVFFNDSNENIAALHTQEYSKDEFNVCEDANEARNIESVTPSKPELAVNISVCDNPADMGSLFEEDKEASIGKIVDLSSYHERFDDVKHDLSIENNISGVKDQVGDHRHSLCYLDSSLKKLYESKDYLGDSVSGIDQSADESLTPLTCKSNANYEKSSGMSVNAFECLERRITENEDHNESLCVDSALKKLYEEEASPFKDVISDNSNGVAKFADESLVRSVGELSDNYKQSNEMSVVIDSECAEQSGILTVVEWTVDNEDHNEAKGRDTGFPGAFKEPTDDHLDSALKRLYEAEASPGDNENRNKGMMKELCIENYDNVNDFNQSVAERLTPSTCSSNGNCDQINEMAIPAFQSPEEKIEESITGKKYHDVTCMRQDTNKKVSATKIVARDGFSIEKYFQGVAKQVDSLSCLDSAFKKLSEGEPSPSQDVIGDKSVSRDLCIDEHVNGVSESANEDVIPLICKSYGNDEESNIMITENEDHGTEIDHSYLKLGMETRNDAGENETISDEMMELNSLFQEDQCHNLNGSSAKSTAINHPKLSAVKVNECKGVDVMHGSDFLSPSQRICGSESKSLADDNIVNSGKSIDLGNVDSFSPLKMGMGVCSADENRTYKEEDTIRENVGLSKHFKCQEDYEHRESAKEKVNQCKDANNEAGFMHDSENKCLALQDGEAMNCGASLEVGPACVLSLLKPEMAVDCSVDNTPVDIDACEHTDNAINVIDVLVSKEQVNDQKDSPCFRSALKKLLEQEFSPTKDLVKSHLFTSREMSLFLGDAERIEGFNTNAVVQESSMKDDVEEIMENTIYHEHGVERSICEQNKQMEMNFEEMEVSQDKVIHETGDVLKEQDGINSENGSLLVSADKIILVENANGSENDPSNVMQGCDSKNVGKDSISGSNIDDPEFMVKSKNVEDDSEPSMLSNDQIATGGIVSANIDELESTVEKKVSEPAEETVEFSYDQKEPDTRMVHHSSAVNFAIEKEVAVEELLRPFVQNKTPEAKNSNAIMFSKQFSSSTMKFETNKTNLVQGTDMKENAAISKSEQLGYVTAPRANRRPLEELRKS